MSTPSKTAAELFRHIDASLSTMSHGEARNAWNLLTALRGPDTQDVQHIPYKAAGATEIRYRMLPRTFVTVLHRVCSPRHLMHQTQTVSELITYWEEQYKTAWGALTHYVWHMQDAFDALLQVQENPPKE